MGKKIGDIFSGLDIKLPNLATHLSVPQIDTSMLDSIHEENSRRIEREKAMVAALEDIAKNTSNLHELVSLVRKGNEVNEKTFELFQDISSVMKASTKEEAEDIVRNALDKAHQAKEDLETIQGLVNYGQMLIKLIFHSTC